jgi:Putative DNA-binding domain
VSLFDELNSLQDVQDLIDDREVRESDILEFKTAPDQMQPADKNAAAKALSAFANSAGGLLIYGVATKDQKDPERPTAIEPISGGNAAYLLKHAREAVRHPIPGIRDKSIPAGQGRQVLLFDVPQSPLSPHQLVSEAVYYRRQGPQSVRMPHDLVELYFGRRMHAKLEPKILKYSEPENPEPERVQCRMDLGLLNTGGQIGRDVFTRIVEVKGRAWSLNVEDVPIETRRSVIEQSAQGRVFSHQQSHAELYYPGVPKYILRFTFTAHEKTIGREKPVLFLDVYAADSRPYRYNLFRTHEYGEAVIQWEEGGLPPAVV